MATKTKSDVALTENKAQLPAEIDPEYLAMIQGDAGKGVSDMALDDVGIPYLYVLQSMSPQVNSDHSAYIKGAVAGMFMNNLSQEIFAGREVDAGGLDVIPCAYERKYVEWVDRDKGGGWVADHDINSDILKECKPDARGRPMLGKDHIIVETAYHYLYFRNPHNGLWEEVVLPTKSTMLKKSRRWNKQLMSTVIPGTQNIAPRWLYPWRLVTVKEQKGDQIWSNIEVTRGEQMVTMEQYKKAKQFADLINQGLIKRATEVKDDPLTGDPGERASTGRPVGEGGAAGNFKDEVPF